MADTADTAEQAWRVAVTAVLKGADPDTLTTRTRDGLQVRPLDAPAPSLGPGPWRDTARPFGIVQRVDHPEAPEARTLALADLAGGANGLALVGRGTGTAHGFGIAPGGLVGVLDGVVLGAVALRLDLAPEDRSAAVDALVALAARQGFAPDALDLDLGIDPLGTGGNALRSVVAATRDRGLVSPLLRADGRIHHAAGASEAQELAAVLSAGVAALRALEPLGLAEAQRSISFTLVADADQLLTTAKFRALRRLWASVESACGLPPRPLRLHANTAWRMLARLDPHTNILRSTIASAAAILGGADSLTVLPFTSALGLPDAFARRLARNTPLVLLEESGLGRVADPAAGSGSYEALTTLLAEEAWRLFQSLEAAGGLGHALATGAWQHEVAAMCEARRAAIAEGQATLVGVTRFGNPGEALPPVLRPLPAGVTTASGEALRPWRDAEDRERAAGLLLEEVSA